MPISEFTEGWFVFMATKLGRVKKLIYHSLNAQGAQVRLRLV